MHYFYEKCNQSPYAESPSQLYQYGFDLQFVFVRLGFIVCCSFSCKRDVKSKSCKHPINLSSYFLYIRFVAVLVMCSWC